MKGIIISHYARFGKNARIFHQVTIGNDDKDIENAPIIGDNVTIYPGVKILGKVRVGDNCRIGANAVVTENVPDNSLVVVQKSRTICKDEC